MRRLLRPLVPAYAAAQALAQAARAPARRLAWPVVSIGNLSVGGAGKTPFAIALARELTARGWSPDVLSRGYGRRGRSVEQVDISRADAVMRYGDEPVLIARAGLAVFVGRRRIEAGRLAESVLAGARPVHILDDGMQHRELDRDAEIVLLHRSDFSSPLLPAGRLREPLTALRRADFVVLREEDQEMRARALPRMREDAALWLVRRELAIPVLPGAAVVFSAIAHPREFAAQLRAGGVEVAAERAWRDHHAFTARDVRELISLAASRRASCFLTTAKDAVRLSSAQRAEIETRAPLFTAELRVSLLDAPEALERLEQRIDRRRLQA